MALNNWEQFPSNWTQIYDPHHKIAKNNTIVVLFRVLGVWWSNGARLVYTFDEPNQYGFAYGTLEGHAEEGEEVFWLEWSESDEIIYHIDAFSRPSHWLVWIGYPIARYHQRKFQKERFPSGRSNSSPSHQG